MYTILVLMSYSYNDKAFCVLLFADMNKLVIVFALVALVAAAHANYFYPTYPKGVYGKYGGLVGGNFGGGFSPKVISVV